MTDRPQGNGLRAGRWAPTHQHKKGGLYRVLGDAIWEPERTPVVIYDDADGTVWVRPAAEFDDGRFTPLTVAPPAAKATPGLLGRLLGTKPGSSS